MNTEYDPFGDERFMDIIHNVTLAESEQLSAKMRDDTSAAVSDIAFAEALMTPRKPVTRTFPLQRKRTAPFGGIEKLEGRNESVT